MLLKSLTSKCLPVVLIVIILAFSVLNIQPVQAAGVVGACTEAALNAAVAGGGAVTFSVDCAVTPIVLTAPVVIAVDGTIDGAGHKVTISGENVTRLFSINKNRIVTIANLTLINGRATAASAGGSSGGAIYNLGLLTLQNVTFSGNSAVGSGAVPGLGGAIYTNHTITITNSTFENNSASGGTSASMGGAIFNDDGIMNLYSTTFSGNNASAGGGAVHVRRTSHKGPTALLRNSIVTASSGSNCAVSRDSAAYPLPTISDGGGNLSFGDTTCPADSNGNPMLGLLADNGGLTPTMALQAGSSAINLSTASCPPADQRNVLRSTPCDSGAYEYGIVTAMTLASPTPDPSPYGTTIAFTATITPNPGAGVVTFREGATVLGTAPLDAGGTAAFSFNGFSAGPHSITAAYAGSDTYSPASSVLDRVVVPAPVTVTADAKTKVYGDADPGLTYQITSGALVGSDQITGLLTRAAGEAVSSYAILQGTLTAGPNYNLTYQGADLEILPRPITVTADAKTKVYGDADPGLTYQLTNGTLVGTDAISGALARAAGEDAGAHAILQGTLTAGPNYAMTFESANLTITPRPVTVTAEPQSKVYGDPDPALSFQVTAGTLVGTDSFSGTLTRAAGEDAGPYAILQGTLALNSNYTLTYIGADLTITTRPVAVTAEAKSKVYGEADPALTYTFSPALITGDSFSGALTRAPGEDASIYPIAQGTLALNSNYTLTFTGADLTITQKPVTITAEAKSKVYGDADPQLTYTVSPALITGDSFTGALARAAGEAVGAHAIQQGDLALSSNYQVTFTGAIMTITEKPVAVAALPASKVYGNADPELVYTVSPALVTGDSFTGALAREAGEDVGPYAIGQGTLALSANYTLTFTGANLTITEKPVTVTAEAKSKVYGEADPALTYTASPALVTGDSFTGALARTGSENAGAYEIEKGTLALNGNYAVTFVEAAFVITPRPITVTAAPANKTYGEADPTFAYTAAPDPLPGDVFTGALTHAGSDDAGTRAIQPGTLSLGDNYAITFISADFVIQPFAVTVTASDRGKVYGEADPELTYTVSPALVSGDSFSGALAREAGEDVGDYAIGQGTLSLSSNYTLSFTGANLSITPAVLTVTADDKTRGFGTANPVLTYTITGFVRGDTIAVVSGSPALSTSAAPSSPGGAYPITISKGDLSAANYTFSFVDGTLTVQQHLIFLPQLSR